MPNNSIKRVPINITNINEIIDLIVTASSSTDKLTISLPFINIDGATVTAYKQEDEIILGANVDVSYYEICFAVLEYTKTTN